MTLDVQPQPVSVYTVTRQQLTDTKGVVQAKYPPSPAIRALISLLKEETGGTLKAGVGLPIVLVRKSTSVLQMNLSKPA